MRVVVRGSETRYVDRGVRERMSMWQGRTCSEKALNAAAVADERQDT